MAGSNCKLARELIMRTHKRKNTIWLFFSKIFSSNWLFFYSSMIFCSKYQFQYVISTFRHPVIVHIFEAFKQSLSVSHVQESLRSITKEFWKEDVFDYYTIFKKGFDNFLLIKKCRDNVSCSCEMNEGASQQEATTCNSK